MTHARKIEKLEAQVAALRARLSARTDQLLLVLLQIEDLKRELDQAKRPVHPAPSSSIC
jgi:chromosome segregation ATPase